MSARVSASVAPNPVDLDRLPLAALLLGIDGSATAANELWTDMTRQGWERSEGWGWLRAIEPVDRDALTRRLRRAAATGTGGSIDCRLVGPTGPRWSRWWWRPESNGGLVACVADIGDDGRQTRSRREHDIGSVGIGSVGPPPATARTAESVDDPAAAVRDAVAALIGAERQLATTWSTVVADQLVDRDVKDRLAQAAHLAQSAVRVLRSDTLH